MTTLRCGLTCQQFAAVPILLEGSSIGMVVLSRSLADVTREAREVSGSEVALLVAGYTGTNRLEASRQLPEWNGHLVALTSRETTLPLLERAARSAPIAELAKRPLNLSYAQRDLELSAVYMENDADWRSTGYFLLISDVTAQVVAIQKATNTLLLLGVAGWLLNCYSSPFYWVPWHAYVEWPRCYRRWPEGTLRRYAANCLSARHGSPTKSMW